ncbi:hypothetical protein B0T26DRAFT_688382 [Lasiosphaeria miniovina]|uniref:Uncharacterized protein n=1 Tax=Lasiosphaeria miniovina TaxID=1954250 RepID=A0AA40EGE8_9PEZI|nr:uncharacterized protein B0T26DRAFT_688382 [Lasiosphaeria miniovina]KAK0734418.1 hypothetical protein B0T26DRAFT_688382 [Lasiosphaeria miniovina]
MGVRNRFETYFGEGNRVDVVGNHTFVSVDTVSMSAAASKDTGRHDLKPIYRPTEHFLNDVKRTKQKAVEKELRFLRGEVPEVQFHHKIEELEKADFGDQPTLGEGAPDLPTILLTHVPLWRPEGTPCGPLREHWPPTKPPKGQTEPVVPDSRNAISISRGYQYQNVLGEKDSVSLVGKVGNVVHAFSGDDHDHCYVVHGANQGGVPEITVKSISMAMGVSTPGFLMLSLYNPIDADGKPLTGAGKPTLQTHLCLLPRQPSTYVRYTTFAFVCIALLTIRAFLVPVLKLSRFALDPEPTRNSSILPVFKAKVEDYDEYALPSAGFSASHFLYGSGTRDRSGSVTTGGSRPGNTMTQNRNVASPKSSKKSHHSHSKGASGSKWGWSGQSRGPPRIEIRSENEDIYDGGKWKAAIARPRSTVNVVATELWTSVFRVVWMAVLFFGWLTWKG